MGTPDFQVPSGNPFDETPDVASIARAVTQPHVASGEDTAAYEALLVSLRKDLQLDATTDVQPGTIALAVLNDAGRATSATTGAAAALPADPAGYLVFRDAKNNTYKIPFYNL